MKQFKLTIKCNIEKIIKIEEDEFDREDQINSYLAYNAIEFVRETARQLQDYFEMKKE